MSMVKKMIALVCTGALCIGLVGAVLAENDNVGVCHHELTTTSTVYTYKNAHASIHVKNTYEVEKCIYCGEELSSALKKSTAESHTKVFYTYQYDRASTHIKNTYEMEKCIYCEGEQGSVIRKESIAESHTSTGEIYGFHIEGLPYHTFYEVCKYCNSRIHQEIILCPGGNHHVNPND